jgi:hypothetical protein
VLAGLMKRIVEGSEAVSLSSTTALP